MYYFTRFMYFTPTSPLSPTMTKRGKKHEKRHLQS